MHIEDWCDDIVTSFALQAMIGAVGSGNVAAWCEAHPALESPISDGEQPVVDQEGEEDAMEVETQVLGEDREGAAQTNQAQDTRSLVYAFTQLQSGDGLQAALPVVGEAERESYAKRAVQLLSQLCLVDLPMLGGFVDLYSVWASTADAAGGANGRETPREDANAAGSSGEAVDGAVAAEENEASTAKPGNFELIWNNFLSLVSERSIILSRSATAAWTLPVTLRSELRNVLPAISQGNSLESIFDVLARRCDRPCWPLMEYALNLLLADLAVPASLTLIQKVRRFVLHDSALETAGDGAEDSGAAEETKEMQVDDAPSTVSIQDIADTDAFKLMLPLVGGVATAEVEAVLPRIVGLFEEDAEGLKKIFARITKARPPPLTKSALLVALHRYIQALSIVLFHCQIFYLNNTII